MDDARAISGAVSPSSEIPVQIPEEERLRAEIYGLLARVLVAPPDAELLRALTQLRGDGSELGAAFGDLARAAGGMTVEAAGREYHDLFIGLGRGELLPYASYYLTGFLHEKPLAKLRGALATLGIERAADVKEPEDHIAALCETIAGLIAGAFGPAASLDEQRKFFDAFIAPWAGRFFRDLEAAQAARLYAAIGRIGRLFLGVEQMAFAIA
ncbi:MAG: molecular chaperone TorD family protein [Alphaproteobacteria bacterium]|nr:molecular chaperone TorD family protein [Alphaproteobacteria bacterium]MDE2496058.1 molecular chaperone TorD family protein [Alphaproteobacteria bacterium]